MPGAVFTFDHINYKGGAMDSLLSVWRESPADPLEKLEYDPQRVFRYHLSGRSLSSVTAYRRELEKFHGDDLNWGKLIHDAIRMAEAEYVGTVASVDPWPDEDDEPHGPSLVEGVFPLNRVSCVFGMGESAKSLGIEAMMADVSQGRESLGRATVSRNILWLDYESESQQDFAMRRHLLGMGGWDYYPGSIRWMPALGVPLVDLVERIAKEMKQFGAKVFVCDSVAFACGGDMVKAEVATGFYAALSTLPLSTKILIAHTNRIEDDKYPFGSIFWHNGIHGTSWFVKAAKDEESVTQGWYVRKNSDGRRPKDFAIRFNFAPSGAISLTEGNLHSLNDTLGRRSVADKIRTALSDGKMTVNDLAQAIDEKADTVRVRLNEMKAKGQARRLEDGCWGLAG